ncbi:MAG: class I SAM-dependent methyltransferase, partial [Ruminococcaceae bacterium]|nr:class I SAM-dependent methyltransferase [Oscillospiraceae bacterium]
MVRQKKRGQWEARIVVGHKDDGKPIYRYDEHMMTNIEYASEFYPFTAKQLPTAENCQVLDLGCGTGLELQEYYTLNPSAKVTGIDLSQ